MFGIRIKMCGEVPQLNAGTLSKKCTLVSLNIVPHQVPEQYQDVKVAEHNKNCQQLFVASCMYEELQEHFEEVWQVVKNAEGQYVMPIDNIVVDSVMDSLTEEVGDGNISVREATSAFLALIRYIIKPGSCYKSLPVTEIVNALEYKILTDNRYDPHVECLPEKPSRWKSIYRLKAAPHDFKGAAILVGCPDMHDRKGEGEQSSDGTK